MRALIFANGAPPSPELARRLADDSDLLIGADGGALSALECGVKVDLVCGDFDSLADDEIRRRLPAARLTPLADQNASDLEKTLRYAVSLGADCIVVTGALGGRPDHALANAALLLQGVPGAEVEFHEAAAVLRAMRPNGGNAALELECRVGDTVSVVAFQPGARITEEGVEWPAVDLELPPGARGVSNRATETRVRITVAGAPVLVCHLRCPM